MQPKSHDSMRRLEEAHMEKIYQSLDKKLAIFCGDVERCEQRVETGAFEDQEASTAYSELSSASEKRANFSRLYYSLCPKPYFAHIELKDPAAENPEHFFLSDCEALETLECFEDDGITRHLLPFKQSREKPLFSALFHCYQAQNGEDVRYISLVGGRIEVVYQTRLICDDEIDNRQLTSAVQLYPKTDEISIDADELLQQKLDENRNDPSLRNIIATLQKKQFQIIDTNPQTSFVVQGCAGSGKSQCLLHRLFFLRDILSQDGWEHVLLLTPTQLFRNYSLELIRRYRLTAIHNCSLAELYRLLLSAYDSRFQNRQYQFELSEEYLPDEYLRTVYDEATIQDVERGIDSAFRRYVEDACSDLGIAPAEVIDANSIAGLLRQLEGEIAAYDSREAILSKDMEYEEKHDTYQRLQKQLSEKQRSLEQLLKDQAENEERTEQLGKAMEAVCAARQDVEIWNQLRKDDIASVKRKLEELTKKFSGDFSPDIPGKYAYQLDLAERLTSGAEYDELEADSQRLERVREDAEQRLLSLIGGQKPEKLGARYQKRQAEFQKRIQSVSEEIERISLRLSECADWLKSRAGELEGEKAQIHLQSSELNRARYFLSRIESTVFEQVVWGILLPFKEQFGVKALDISTAGDGHQRETRILYKSDLLFYLKVYSRIHSGDRLPDYRLFCIDEGQDLHKADYDMLHALYPNAVFNVFGDTAQVLHTECGVRDWKSDTGIHTVYTLDRNYRNTAAVVDFCNQTFGSAMKAVGRVRQDLYPHTLPDAAGLRQAVRLAGISVIVRDRRHFEQMCLDCGLPAEAFEFLDTKAEKPQGRGIPCYSIFAAKGLEFASVAVYAKGMTTNQKVVACTRTMGGLYYYE